jgi:hypothetical protein
VSSIGNFRILVTLVSIKPFKNHARELSIDIDRFDYDAITIVLKGKDAEKFKSIIPSAY